MFVIDFRPAIAADVASVLPMVRKLCALHEGWDSAKYGFAPDILEKYATWLPARSADPRSVFLVAERRADGDLPARLVGFLIGTVEREIGIYRLKEFGFIHDLWVEEEYRHEGVGRQLVMLAIERFGQIGVRQIRLDTAARNEPARKLFEACGFRVSITEMLLELGSE